MTQPAGNEQGPSDGGQSENIGTWQKFENRIYDNVEKQAFSQEKDKND